MNTTDINKNIAAPSVTIAPRQLNSQHSTINHQLQYVVTLTTHKEVRSYPCRSMESAIKLAQRFIAGVTKPRPSEKAPGNSELSTLNPQLSTSAVAA